MSGLVTRCQVCATAFRVQRAQLAARGGKVRCGKCGTVFDGVAGLVEEGTQLLHLEPSPQLGLFDPSRRPAQDAARRDEDMAVPEFLADEPPPPAGRLAWAMLAFVAGAALALQAGYRYRSEIGVLFPSARPALQAACSFAGCAVPLPRRPELMSIDSSDLQADTRSESLIVLNALLRNRAPFPQDYPSLELTLTDDADQPVLRRVLAPREYLDKPRAGSAAQGLPAGAEANLRVNLDTDGVRATGYRLYLFYPQ
ncbi:MAG: DUF3426 domain-containing protein [Clostridia bacterium]